MKKAEPKCELECFNESCQISWRLGSSIRIKFSNRIVVSENVNDSEAKNRTILID